MNPSKNNIAAAVPSSKGAPAAVELAISLSEPRTGSLAGVLVDYASIARPDHWLKNVFMLIGVVLAYFYTPTLLWGFDFVKLLIAFFATCLVASSNYVLNEILDAPTDANHPEKHNRPIPSGRVWLPAAYAEWLLLGGVGVVLAWCVNVSFLLAAASLWLMGLVYNIRPIRSKDLPYVDVLSESV